MSGFRPQVDQKCRMWDDEHQHVGCHERCGVATCVLRLPRSSLGGESAATNLPGIVAHHVEGELEGPRYFVADDPLGQKPSKFVLVDAFDTTAGSICTIA